MVSLTRQWLLVLLAPSTWATAHGILFSLTNDSCLSGSRESMFLVVAASILLAAVPAPIALTERRGIPLETRSGERIRFMLGLAAGGSVLFALVLMLVAIPIFFLDPCRI
jgi:hypothetical protein